MKKVLVVAFMLSAGYLLAPQSAMADPVVSLRIGFGIPIWPRAAYVVERPQREVFVEHRGYDGRYERREEFDRRDSDRGHSRAGNEDRGGHQGRDGHDGGHR